MKPSDAKEKVDDWFKLAESNEHYGSITVSVMPGNPAPQIVIRREETEK